MSCFRAPYTIAVVIIVIVSWNNFGSGQQGRMMRPMQQLFRPRKVPPLICSIDSIMLYQDCRICVCPRPNRVAKCYKKSCDLRTKDYGQCPTAVLKIDDSRNCPMVQIPTCMIDADCPGGQFCCFDFCLGAKCMNPVPLDVITGMVVHKGRGYQ